MASTFMRLPFQLFATIPVADLACLHCACAKSVFKKIYIKSLGEADVFLVDNLQTPRVWEPVVLITNCSTILTNEGNANTFKTKDKPLTAVEATNNDI